MKFSGTLIMVIRRFLDNGLSIEETAIRMDVPIDYVKSCSEYSKPEVS